MLRPWPFNGGVHLEGHKQESNFAPLIIPPLPKTLIYPLPQLNSGNGNILVASGDRVLKGQAIVVSDNPMLPPVHAASSGWVRCIEQRPLPHLSGLTGDCAVIDVDGLDESVEFQGFPNYAEVEQAGLCARIHAAGIVGLGGAAFPTMVKLKPPKHLKVETLVLNGAECEPYITCDDSLSRHFPHAVLGGAKILMHILGVACCLLAVEEDMPQAIAALEKAKSEGQKKSERPENSRGCA